MEVNGNKNEEIVEFRSRGYQNELLRICLEKNTIIYLPTGAGKTYIAIMAMKHFAKDVQKPIAEGGKRTVFLTNTVVLAHQQKDCVERLTALKVAVYTGDSNVDAWRQNKWNSEFENNQIIVATCQIILDVVRAGYIKMSDFNLLIFDECHNATKEHPMHQFMNEYSKSPDPKPRVIGLTGTLTSANVKPLNVVDDLKRLECTFHAAIATIKGLEAFNEVLTFSTAPKEKIIEYEIKAQETPVIAYIANEVHHLIKTISLWPIDASHMKTAPNLAKDRQPSPLKTLTQLMKDFVYHINNFGLYGGTIAALAVLVELEIKKRESDTNIMKLLLRALITRCEEFLHLLTYAMDEDEESDDEMEVDDEAPIKKEKKESRSRILTNSAPKVQQLLQFLYNFTKECCGKELKAIIFVERRRTAKILSHVIKRYATGIGEPIAIWADFMVGNNSKIPDSIESLLCNKSNRKVVENFKQNDLNVIVSTSVLEEGIDIQECNLVVMYDLPKTFRAYAQSKGRARMANSQYVMFAPIGGRGKLEQKLSEWKVVNDILRNYLVAKMIDREPPQKDYIEKEFMDRLNKTYVTPGGGKVDMLSALSLLSRYCQILPSDQFTIPSVSWTLVKNEATKVVSILMPIQSQIRKEIISDEMPSIKIAARSAALKAIQLLHEAGEIDDHLIPYNKIKLPPNVNDLYFNHWTPYRQEKPHLAGSKKNYRVHELQIPDQLIESLPRIQSNLYLYRIQFRPKFKQDDSNIEIFYNLFNSDQNYGILTAKPLPKMGSMKFYQSFGSIQCAIDSSAVCIVIPTNEKLLHLKRFNHTLFRDILDIKKTFLAFDSKDSFIIVPTNGNEINWNIVENFQKLKPIKSKTDAERKNEQYNYDDWIFRVICPWYRRDTATRYVVTKVNTSLNPISPFPNDDFQTYASYVKDKYDVSVIHSDQFLIEVKGITTHLNRIHAGDGEDGRKKMNARGPEFLIPELCHNFEYPGDLWLKATLLPSILHRITYILHAENMRLYLNNGLGLSVENYIPQPVIEHMAKVPIIQEEKAPIMNAIVFPRPGESQPKAFLSRDIVPLSESIACPWPESMEPLDLDRKFDEAHSVDIDYFVNFIQEKFVDMGIVERGQDKIPTLLKSVMSPQKALCDVPSPEKFRIKLLEIPFNQLMPRGIEQHNLLAALTAASSADVFDMERFEVLGDAFLKFGISLYLLQKHENWHEGHLTSIKGRIVSNRNLCYCSFNINLPGKIKIHDFKPKDDWQPPMLKTSPLVQNALRTLSASPRALFGIDLTDSEREHGEAAQEDLIQLIERIRIDTNFLVNTASERSPMLQFIGQQSVADKTCADCIEAILGCCLEAAGVERTFKALELFGIIPKIQNHDISKMLEKKLTAPRIRTNISDSEVDAFLINYAILEKSIGYKFKDRAYLLQALTHPTFPTNRITGCYQQLEFLGDAVLDFLITTYIYERCSEMDPGTLTDLRSALVNNVTLACLCVRYNIHVHILSQNAALAETISLFQRFQVKNNHEVTEHVQLLMEEQDAESTCKQYNLADRIAEYIDVPKTLGDVFEALIGGIFLDSGNDLKVTWKVIYGLMHKELDKFMANVPIQVVRKLYEFPNANPQFDEARVEDDIVMVPLTFTCNGQILSVYGCSNNKENAKRAAAKLALLKLQA